MTAAKDRPETHSPDGILAAQSRPISASEQTVDNLHAEIETLAGDLRAPLPNDPYQAEPACRGAVEKARAIGQDAFEHPRPAPSGAISPAAPSQIGPYRILALLGQGGMGAVYKALHPRLDKVVALKVLASGRLNTNEAIGRFEREMKAVGKLDHPHLIRALDAGEADGVHYLAMEFVDGADLAALIRERSPLPTNIACELVIQAASALQAAHTRGMVHRDIKPANLMLARQEFGPPVVKVLDLGLALLADKHATGGGGLTSDGQVMGTIDYMAPEQATDSHTVDIRADVYSLGATLYALLTGGPILQDRPNLSLMQKLMVLATEPVPPLRDRRPEVSPALAAIVHKMLARKPEDRYATPAAAAAALRPFAAGAELSTLDDAATIETAPSHIDLYDKTAVLPTAEFRQAPTVALDSRNGSAPPPSRRRTLVGAAALAGAGLLAAIVLLFKTPHGDLEVSIPDDVPAEIRKQIQINVTGSGDAEIASEANGWKIHVKEGEYQVKLTGGGDQVEMKDKQITVRRDKLAVVNIVLKQPGGSPNAPVSPPANATADAHRQLAVWLKSLDPPQPMEVKLADGTLVGVQSQDPLPDGPFQMITIHLMGKAADLQGDALLEDLGRRAQGIRLHWLNLKSDSMTTAGLVSLFQKLDSTELGVVGIQGERLGDDLIEALGDCPRLESLTLSCSEQMTGRNLPRLKRLQMAHLVNAHLLSPDAFKELEQLPRLNSLQLGGFPFRSDQADLVGRLKISMLVAQRSVIDDALLARIVQNLNLERLHIDGNPITDNSLAAIKKLQRLIHINLTDTKVTAAGVADLQQALPNCTIDWTAPKAMPASPPGEPTADAHRKLAKWLRSLDPPQTMEVTFPDGGGNRITPQDPLPEGPFQVNVLYLQGTEFDRRGDALLDELASRIRGFHITGLLIGSTSMTSAGAARLIQMPELSDLGFLSLAGDEVTDEVFEALAGLPRLQTIELRCPRLTGRGLHHLQKVRGLASHAGTWSPEGIRELDQAPQLDTLQIGGFPFTLEHADAFARLKLKALFTGNAGITDAIVARLADMENLENLSLYRSETTDQGLQAIKKLKKLNNLDLTDTQVTAAGVADLQQALPNLKINWTPPAN
jgi:serine/threonine protein kinase